jgi:3-oxoacyl-[acyl-carrier protein] reductase
MRRNGCGRFIAISSNPIGTAEQGLTAYMARKMGAIGLIRGLANDVAAADALRPMRVLPSLTRTLATADVLDEAKQLVAQQQAIKRLAEPEDIVGPIPRQRRTYRWNRWIISKSYWLLPIVHNS